MKLILCMIAMLVFSFQANATVFSIYVSSTGSDRQDGLSESTAIRTLNRANDLLENNYRPTTAVEIVIQPGTYTRQHVEWTFVNGRTITFTPPRTVTSRPVFDGMGGDTWFKLTSSAGKNTRLYFRRLTVRNYWMAIDFLGNREDFDEWNGGNQIRGMRFERIGGIYGTGSRSYSYAAIRLVNSRGNRILGNVFRNIENTDREASYIHAIYAAHASDGNLIQDNKFVAVNGDAVRVRDDSHGNQVNRNTFQHAGKRAAFSDWFCTEDCSIGRPECPSQGNQFNDNVVGEGYYGKILPVMTFGPNAACGELLYKRINESGTVQE